MFDATQYAICRALRGRTILLVGGDTNRHALARLRDVLGLAEARHAPTRKSDPSPRRFASHLHTPGLVLVLAIRGLTRTNHGKYLHSACRALGIPVVDCFHIPHPNALLAKIAELRLLPSISKREGRAS